METVAFVGRNRGSTHELGQLSRGLAANQVFRPVRICAIEVGDNPRYPYKPKIPLTILVNPKLTPVSEARFDNYEGCLSVPDLRGVVPRFAELRVQALDRDGAPIDQIVRGITAGTYQHECDHLDGILYIDRCDTRTLSFVREYRRYGGMFEAEEEDAEDDVAVIFFVFAKLDEAVVASIWVNEGQDVRLWREFVVV